MYTDLCAELKFGDEADEDLRTVQDEHKMRMILRLGPTSKLPYLMSRQSRGTQVVREVYDHMKLVIYTSIGVTYLRVMFRITAPGNRYDHFCCK